MKKLTKKEQRKAHMAALGRRRQALLREQLGEKKYRALQKKNGSKGGRKSWA